MKNPQRANPYGQAGFTMVELLVAMTVFVLSLAAASQIFAPLITQSKQQSKLSESNIEGLVGLDILRRDISQAGLGLPWAIDAGVVYQEASSATTSPIPAPNTYNDAANPPRAFLIGNDVAGLDGSDYLVIKSAIVATNDAAPNWTYMIKTDTGAVDVKGWGALATDNLQANDKVIVINTADAKLKRDAANNFTALFNEAAFPSAFHPTTPHSVFLIYGIDPADSTYTNLRMPFNRADYYIRKVSGTTIPSRCAKGTGVLMKSVIKQKDGERGPGLPLLDCVADMQVIFRMDTDGDEVIDTDTNDLSALNAEQVREQVKEVRVYILAHEGGKDPSYTHSSSTITVGEFGLGRVFLLSTITDWQNYRWKLYTFVVNPRNLFVKLPEK